MPRACKSVFTSEQIRQFLQAPGPAERHTAPPLRLSIVMPSFNHARFIERSLISVINQGHEPTELIVIDGGSRDGTVEILEKYSRHIAHWSSEPDQGQSDALNKGFARATGQVYGWLNSDDVYLPGAAHHAARLFSANPQIDVVYGDWLTIDLNDRLVEHCPALAPSRTRLVTEGFFCNAQAMFWRASLHRRIGTFDTQLHYTMDYDLMLRMISEAGRRRFLRTGRALGCFRVYAGQKTGSLNHRVAEEHRRIAQRAGTGWKYSPGGRALRLAYRAARGAEYLARQRRDHLLRKLKSRFGARPGGN